MKKIEVVAALIEQGDRFLACQRPAGKARGLLWEFLGGKVEPGEPREEAIVRECREEIGVTIAVHGIVAEVTHEYEELTVHLTLLRALISEGEPQALEHADIRFITIAEAEGYPFCAADQELLRIVREEKERKHMDHATKARELFCSGYNCAQAVAGAFAEDMGLPLETVTKLASGFGGGMGGMRETCGAVTGMFMVAGMMKGHALPANNEEKTRTTRVSARWRMRSRRSMTRSSAAICSPACRASSIRTRPSVPPNTTRPVPALCLWRMRRGLWKRCWKNKEKAVLCTAF